MNKKWETIPHEPLEEDGKFGIVAKGIDPRTTEYRIVIEPDRIVHPMSYGTEYPVENWELMWNSSHDAGSHNIKIPKLDGDLDKLYAIEIQGDFEATAIFNGDTGEVNYWVDPLPRHPYKGHPPIGKTAFFSAETGQKRTLGTKMRDGQVITTEWLNTCDNVTEIMLHIQAKSNIFIEFMRRR